MISFSLSISLVLSFAGRGRAMITGSARIYPGTTRLFGAQARSPGGLTIDLISFSLSISLVLSLLVGIGPRIDRGGGRGGLREVPGFIRVRPVYLERKRGRPEGLQLI